MQATILEVPAEKIAAVAPIEVRLIAVRYAARDILLFEFSRPNGHLLPAAEPGAHVDIHLPNGVMRSYSLVNPDNAPQSYTLAIKRDFVSRGGSRYIFDNLHVGEVLKISHPRNNFPLSKDARHTVLIAGGIGITPIWAMAQYLRAANSSWEMFYSCPSRADMAFFEILKTSESVHLHFDDESLGDFLNIEAIIAKVPKDTHFYCCGPSAMLDRFERATKNVLSEQVHIERFAPKHAKNLDGDFTVELARSGRTLLIPAGKSILQTLREAGLNVASSCEEGVCGACETAIISGIPDHRDSILTDKERAANRSMMICCSGSRTEQLVLDI